MAESIEERDKRDKRLKAFAKPLGDRLRLVRKHMKLSQEEVAEAIGYSQSRISNWETGKDNMYAYQLMLLAKAIGVSADMILDVENLKGPSKSELRLLSVARIVGSDEAIRLIVEHGERAKIVGLLE